MYLSKLLFSQEICEAPVLFSEGTTRFDIGQGELGTCWFLAMVANIADKPRLLRANNEFLVCFS
jgi:hypothetical protein